MEARAQKVTDRPEPLGTLVVVPAVRHLRVVRVVRIVVVAVVSPVGRVQGLHAQWAEENVLGPLEGRPGVLGVEQFWSLRNVTY